MSIDVQDVFRSHVLWDDSRPVHHIQKDTIVTVGQAGLFIVFEGGEGSGKSTQTQLLNNALAAMGIRCIFTRQPGGTDTGVKIRELLLDRSNAPLTQKSQALLFLADRAEHTKTVIRPAMARGDTVVCDRFAASTIAYQGYAGHLDVTVLRMISDWASDGLRPDITFFLDIDPQIGLERSKRVEHTRFEDESLQYHAAVRRGFLEQRDDSWVTISAEYNACLNAQQIHKKIMQYVLPVLNVHRRFQSEKPLTTVACVAKDCIDPNCSEGKKVPPFLPPIDKSPRGFEPTYALPVSKPIRKIAPTCPSCGSVLKLDADNRQGGAIALYDCVNGHGFMRVDKLHEPVTTEFVSSSPPADDLADVASAVSAPTECGYEGCMVHPKVSDVDVS